MTHMYHKIILYSVQYSESMHLAMVDSCIFDVPSYIVPGNKRRAKVMASIFLPTKRTSYKKNVKHKPNDPQGNMNRKLLSS